MLFNSLDFLLFIGLFFAGWPLLKHRANLRWGYIILASFVFYGWWDWRFLSLLITKATCRFDMFHKMENDELSGKIVMQFELHENGWLGAIPVKPPREITAYRDIFPRYHVNHDQIKRFLEQTNRWRERGITVFAFRPPAYSGTMAVEDQHSGFLYDSFIDRFQQAGGIWLAPEGNWNTYDGVHLGRDEAQSFSQALAKLVFKNLYNKSYTRSD